MMNKLISWREDAEETPESELASGEMSLLDHLDELRQRLVRSAMAIAVAFVVGWIFHSQLYGFLAKPVQDALSRAQRMQVDAAVEADSVWSLQENEPAWYSFPSESTLGNVPVPAGVTIPVVVKRQGDKLVAVTKEKWIVGNAVIPKGTPLPVNVNPSGPTEKLIITTVPGAFSLYVRVAFYAAIVFSMPFLLLQVWGFISPGLYKHERRYVWPFVAMGTVFFMLGAGFGYKIAFPRTADWLLALASDFRPLITANEYFDLIIMIMLGLGLVFQIPTITFFLARIGLVTPRKMVKPWRYIFVIIFIVAAVISPTGDIPNLLVFALPMLVLYVFSIGIAWLFGKPRTESEA